MGSVGDNSGGWPPDGGLPNVPPEWGDIVIPDDLSALSDEVAAVRAELGLTQPRTPWQRFVQHRATRRMRRIAAAGLRVPVLIITMAVLVTIASVFASDWKGPARPPAPQRTTGTAEGGGRLPALDLEDGSGGTVALKGQLPAVVLLIDQCECVGLVTDTANAVRNDITVITVTTGKAPRRVTPAPGSSPAVAAGPQVAGKTIRRLWDPTGELRSSFDLAAPDGTAAALLVDHGGTVLRTVARIASVEELRPDLDRL